MQLGLLFWSASYPLPHASLASQGAHKTKFECRWCSIFCLCFYLLLAICLLFRNPSVPSYCPGTDSWSFSTATYNDWGFSWIFSVPPSKYWDGSPQRPRLLPSTAIAIYYSLFMLLLNARANNMGHWQQHDVSNKQTQSDTPVSWGTFQTKTVNCADP